MFLLLVSVLYHDATVDLFGQHIFGNVGVGGPRQLSKFVAGSKMFADMGKTLLRGPIKGPGPTSLLLMIKDGNACAIVEYDTADGKTRKVNDCGASVPAASLGTDLFAFDEARKEVYFAVDGGASTDYHNQMYRASLVGNKARTGFVTTRSNTGVGSGWSNMGKLLNVGQALVDDDYLLFAMWGDGPAGSEGAGGIFRFNLTASNPPRELLVPNPLNYVQHSCQGKAQMVYGLAMDDTKIFFSAGTHVYYVAKRHPRASPVHVCDCSATLSPQEPNPAPGQIFGLSVSGDSVFVVGATGDTVGHLLTCSVTQRKITHIRSAWNLAQLGDRFVVAVGSGELGLGSLCTSGRCGRGLGQPTVTPYPSGVAQVLGNVVGDARGELGQCFHNGYSVRRFIPNEVKRVTPLGIQRCTRGPVRASESGDIFVLDSPSGKGATLWKILGVKPVLVAAVTQASASLDQDAMAVSPDGKQVFWTRQSGEWMRHDIASNRLTSTGWTTVGPVCFKHPSQSGITDCSLTNRVCNLKISNTEKRCRDAVLAYGQAAISGSHLYVAISRGTRPYTVKGGSEQKMNGGIYKLDISADKGSEITESHLFVANTFWSGCNPNSPSPSSCYAMHGLALDHLTQTLFFSVGTKVYRTPLSSYRAELVCDAAVYLYPLNGVPTAGFIQGLAYNPVAKEVYVAGTNLPKAGRLVTCSVADKKVTYYNKYSEKASAYNNLKYLVAVPGSSPRIGLSTTATTTAAATATSTAGSSGKYVKQVSTKLCASGTKIPTAAECKQAMADLSTDARDSFATVDLSAYPAYCSYHRQRKTWYFNQNQRGGALHTNEPVCRTGPTTKAPTASATVTTAPSSTMSVLSQASSSTRNGYVIVCVMLMLFVIDFININL